MTEHISSGGGAVIVWAAVRVLRLTFRDGLHRCRVEPATCAVAAAVGRRRDPGAALAGGGGHGEGLRGEALRIGPGEWAGREVLST